MMSLMATPIYIPNVQSGVFRWCGLQEVIFSIFCNLIFITIKTEILHNTNLKDLKMKHYHKFYIILDFWLILAPDLFNIAH